MPQILDMLVVGGGINGAGIARDASGRGLSVRLVEKGDLAGATSSVSSKLIHGGLRYLEHGAFRLVREALAEVVVGHFADVPARAAEGRDAGDGVGDRATGHLDRRAHGVREGLELVLLDQ